MGYTIAKEAARRGHKVILVTGPVSLKKPHGVEIVCVDTAAEMLRAVQKHIVNTDCLIMAAAVCDFKPRTRLRQKLKRKRRVVLELVENPDILSEVRRLKGKRIFVGFALETERLIEHAREKLKHKGLDMIVGNLVGGANEPFGQGKTSVVTVGRDGEIREFDGVTKGKFSKILLDKVEETWYRCNDPELVRLRMV
jgi:phosphopantothenoylcysteine decarboxylase/phosphopantothenate--cysteine ligase